MSKREIIVIQTLLEYGQVVADQNTFAPIDNGPVSYRVATTTPEGKVLTVDSGTFPDDRLLLEEAAKRGSPTWGPVDIIALLGL